MYTEEAKVVTDGDLFVNLPLTKPTGKVRVKRRSYFAEYGEPIAPRQCSITQSLYVEWQIGYDLKASDENKGKTSLPQLEFQNYKGEIKCCYELSEILYYAYKLKLISVKEICDAYQAIKAVGERNTFEENSSISRTNPKSVCFNGLDFYAMQVSYPLFVHRFGSYEIFAEIIVREKQRAVGSQAMLYVCVPITSLAFNTQPFGRKLETKECAKWYIGKDEALLSLEMFRVFGMLSAKHRFDVLAIMRMLFSDVIG